jgi:hypothetical protein
MEATGPFDGAVMSTIQTIQTEIKATVGDACLRAHTW